MTDTGAEPAFIPGLELASQFYLEAVRPVLDAEFPDVEHSAGLIGTGSEVLGFDTEISADHSWGPRVTLFLSADDLKQHASAIRGALGQQLPYTFRGFSTHFEAVPGEPRSVVPRTTNTRPINHRVQTTALGEFLLSYVGTSLRGAPTLRDWLTTPEQKLRTLVEGAVYHDGLNELAPMRRKLTYYPHDVWLYLLSAQWQRVGQEEPFVGRAGLVGDDRGSAVIASRLVRDVMRLCMLMERQYAPYSKWFGSAFALLDCAEALGPLLDGVLAATSWQERERHLGAAYEVVAAMHNDLGITEPVPTALSAFHDRPFMIIHAESIAKAIWETITDEEVRMLPFGVGKIDQYVDSTDVLSHTDRCRAVAALYEAT